MTMENSGAASLSSKSQGSLDCDGADNGTHIRRIYTRSLEQQSNIHQNIRNRKYSRSIQSLCLSQPRSDVPSRIISYDMCLKRRNTNAIFSTNHLFPDETIYPCSFLAVISYQFWMSRWMFVNVTVIHLNHFKRIILENKTYLDWSLGVVIWARFQRLMNW